MWRQCRRLLLKKQRRKIALSLQGLDHLIQQIQQTFEAIDTSREQALATSRELIRVSATAIKHVHRGEYEQAQEQLQLGRSLVNTLRQTTGQHGDLCAAGFVTDALKEYAEALITFALVREQPLPDMDGNGLDAASYVNGLAEAVGELRRHVVDNIRHGKIAVGERRLEEMDEIYYALMALDFPEVVTRGLRRRTDTVRALIEKTRSDLTLAIRQQDLANAMEKLESILPGSNP